MKHKEQNTKISQLDKANEALKDLAHNVTSEDRKAAGISPIMVVKYLKGEGKDLDTAFRLLKHFRDRIAAREKELAA